MLKLSIISFTENGKSLSIEIANKLRTDGQELSVSLFTKHKICETENGDIPVHYVEGTVGEWAGIQMRERNALLFIGACGIAVRAVAPHLTDKLHDSPVLVMDEKGRYVIPILSGHMGGANALAAWIAARTGAEPVITTATDLNEKFAVDLFAKRNGLAIINKEGIAKVSAKVLAGKSVTMSMEENIIPDSEISSLPPEVCIVPYPPGRQVDIVITSGEPTCGETLKLKPLKEPVCDVALQSMSSGELTCDAAPLLKPKKYIIGLGCKKGKTMEEIDALIQYQLNALNISRAQVLALASISRKQEEQGIVAWCLREGIPFLTYTAEELQEVAGDFSRSEFVRRTVGVDNVCERAALKACGAGGRLISAKHAQNGITIAIVVTD